MWRQFDKTKVEFQWSGGNTHEARLEGAQLLCSRLLDIRRSDPEAEIHLVAHSHGGNVVLRAIELYFEELEREAKRIFDLIAMRPDAVAIDEALKEICGSGTALANLNKFRSLASGIILPILGDLKNKFPLRILLAASSRSNPYLRQSMIRANASVQRLRRAFSEAWSRSPQSHLLGRLVFMGTPFLLQALVAGLKTQSQSCFGY